ncbi:MAG: tetratricopeptide repeat protein [Anaerolineae bacterium]|nr:tetratricopeptide repeat protein [Anaerolineae bacterium]
MLSTLLATKLYRPRPTANLVARSHLTQRLDAGLRNGHRLFLVVAPAGYGKTTLVTEWLGKTAIPSAWLSLDEADNDPLRFFTYVVAAFQQTLGPKLAQPLLEAFPMMPQPPEAFVHPLINDLTAVNQPVVLALDDYHLITSVPVQEAMVFLLEHAPPNLHLVVLTRADPPFPLPRLRVRELMTEIRDRDLRFTPEEVTTFLNSVHHLNLPAQQITALESRTEGWAAGVQLAALSLQGFSAERATQFIDAFSGSHHYIVDYLVEEVLSRQPDQVREFLLHTSILDRMCAPLCDTILSWGAIEQESAGDFRETALALPQHPGDRPPLRSCAQQILETLERTNLFLVPLDDERCWYRYHHLFTDALRQLLTSSAPPDQIVRLHDRASDWYGQNGFAADAYHHTLLAGNYTRAVGILEENAWSMVLHAEFGLLKRWMQALPADLLTRHPWLCIDYAWALVFGESEAAEAQLKAAEQQLQAGGSPLLSAQMQGHITAVRAWIAYQKGEPDQAVVLSRRALELCPQMDPGISSGLMAIAGVGCRTQGDLTGAACAFAEALELAQSSGNILIEVAARTSLGELNQMTGRLHEAEAIYREALQRAILVQSPVAAQAYYALARIHREWNDLASARLYAEKAVEDYHIWGFMDALAIVYVFLANVLQAQNNFPEADHALAQGFQVVQGHALEPRLVPNLGAMRAKLWLAQGKLEDARRWAETRGLSAEGKFDLRNEIEYLALVRILLAEGRVADATRLLSRLQSAIESAGRQGNLVEVLVLRAVALEMQGDTPFALAVLEQAASLARPGGYMRVFLDAGKPIETLLKIAVTQWKDHDLVAYARKLLTAFADESVPPAGGQAPQPGILSERELEVLRLMAAGCSDREIAHELVIATGTAKRHAANIFDKLDVRNRTEAVTKARQLGLL